MKKKKEGKNITIKISNKLFYTLIIIGILATISIGVYAWANPVTGVGHSHEEIEGLELKNKIIEIGSWDMNSAESTVVDIGFDGIRDQIRVVSVLIIDDYDLVYDFHLGYSGPSAYDDSTGGFVVNNQDNLVLYRPPNSFFDTPAFEDSLMNRGWVTIWYEDES